MISQLDTYLHDMQAALRALWPDRPVVYFTPEAFEREEQGPGYLLSDEERDQLSRVAAAIGSARAGEDALGRLAADGAWLRALNDDRDRSVREGNDAALREHDGCRATVMGRPCQWPLGSPCLGYGSTGCGMKAQEA